MNIRNLVVIAIRATILLVIAHIPHLLVYFGLELTLLVLWVGLLENIPLLFSCLKESGWFEINEFGVTSYSWEGLLVSLALKYSLFFLISCLIFFFKEATYKEN